MWRPKCLFGKMWYSYRYPVRTGAICHIGMRLSAVHLVVQGLATSVFPTRVAFRKPFASEPHLPEISHAIAVTGVIR